jgi:hypothetical protein
VQELSRGDKSTSEKPSATLSAEKGEAQRVGQAARQMNMTAGRVIFMLLALAAIVLAFAAISDKWKPAGVDHAPQPAQRELHRPPLPVPGVPGDQ